jgi:hypothetical protein
MKTEIILLTVTTLIALPIPFVRAEHTESTSDSSLMSDEKAIWDAYKNKQADAFKKYMGSGYVGIYAEGVKSLDKEVADMAKTELRSFSFADMKLTHPSTDTATVTYKVTAQATSNGKDVSGTYSAASVYAKQGGKWLAIFHTEIKAE